MFAVGAAVLLTGHVAGRSAENLQASAAPPAAIAPFSSPQAHAHQVAWARYLDTEVVTQNALGIRLLLIPPGEFQMGCPPEQLDETLRWGDRVRQTVPGTERRRITTEECPQHRVVLRQPFLIGMTEVTIGWYKKFVTATSYVTETERFGGGNSASETETDARKTHAIWRSPGYAVTDDSPVTQITWNDAVCFCNWLSEQDSLPPAYRHDPAGAWALTPTSKGYRLPTEAEWEFACRAGTTTHYSFGDDPALLGQYAWYDRNADHLGAGAVASKKPNPFGLHDMHGNVWERCHDWFDAQWYANSPTNDPVGPATGGRRMVRGGAWHYFDLHCRSAYRNNYSPIGRTGNTGFRIARTW